MYVFIYICAQKWIAPGLHCCKPKQQQVAVLGGPLSRPCAQDRDMVHDEKKFVAPRQT